MSTVIRVEGVSKRYRLGVISRRMLYEDLQSRWAKWRGRSDPNAALEGQATGRSGELWALRDVSFEVKDGDVLALIGHNGSGKSTLLKILSQITAPTHGRALLKGRVASLLEVGTGFHPELTGRDNVFLNGVILGMRHDEVARCFDAIVAFSGIEQFIDTPVKRYSSGMRVRLAFAVAAHLNPEILIIDEVLAVGDAAFQQKCLGKMGEIAETGRTILFVSHNAAAVEALCTRGIVLDHGRVTFDGSQTEALAHYASHTVAPTASLADRHDREGSGELRVVRAELRDTAGNPLPSPRGGQDVEVWLHFERHTARDFPTLSVRLSVLTDLGTPVFTHLNDLNHTALGPLPERGAIVCRLPRLPLPAARYRIDYRLLSARRGGAVLDGLRAAAVLAVEPGNFYGTGEIPSAASGLCLVDGEWRLEPAPATLAPTL